MRIRTQLLAVIIASLGVGLLATLLVLAAARREDSASEMQSRAQITSHEVAGLLALTQEYARYSEPRAAQQWHQRHSAIASILNSDGQGPLIGTALVELRAVAQALPPLFSRLEEIPRAGDAFAVRRKEALLDQLLTSTQAMSDYAYRWFQDAVLIRSEAEREFQVVAFAAPCLMLVMLIGTAVVVRKRILLPIIKLDHAASVVGGGDMSCRISSMASDELGDLSRQFDAMTAALVESGSQLRRSEKQLRAITDNLPVLITYVDRNERYVFVNRTFKDWLGVEPSAALGQRVADTISPAHYEQRREYIQRALAGERVTFDIDSEAVGVTKSLHTIYIPDIQLDCSVDGIFTLTTDVSALKNVERQLRLLVRFDTLTGLGNRYQFNEALPLALARAKRSGLAIALMYLDIDHFKSINDTLGHAAGDAVLCEFAQRLQDSVRSTDTVGRLAGDEFVIILEGLHSDVETQLVARKIVAQVNRPFDIDGHMLDVTASVGIAYHGSTSGAMAANTLLAQADEALYAAKKAGRNTFRIASKPVSLECAPP